MTNNQIKAQPITYESLTNVLIRQGLYDDPVLRKLFLDLEPQTTT